jgi:hypothetical protein
MTLRESKQLIRRWISERFSDERLAQVYAFNQDGRMRYCSPCCCLRGVTEAERLHDFDAACDRQHYIRLNTVEGVEAELAYNVLGNVAAHRRNFGDGLRQRRLSAILRAQMRLRARARQPQPELVAAQ